MLPSRDEVSMSESPSPSRNHADLLRVLRVSFNAAEALGNPYVRLDADVVDAVITALAERSETKRPEVTDERNIFEREAQENDKNSEPILGAEERNGELLWAVRGAFIATDEHGRKVWCVSANSCAGIERERNALKAAAPFATAAWVMRPDTGKLVMRRLR